MAPRNVFRLGVLGMLMMLSAPTTVDAAGVDIAWTGSVTDYLYSDTYCGADALMEDEETKVQLLGEGEFCRTGTFSGWGYNWTSTMRTVITCTPEGIFRTLHNCSDASDEAQSCLECWDEAEYVTRWSWADWQDRNSHDTCHGIDILIGEDARADVWDWDQAYRDYYTMAGPDKASLLAFYTDNSCIQNGAVWTGSLTTSNFADEACSDVEDPAYFEETETQVTMISSGVFCMDSTSTSAENGGETTTYYRTEVTCGAEGGTGENPGVYMTSTECTSASCDLCMAQTSFVARWSWEEWEGKTSVDVCHVADIIDEDMDWIQAQFPNWADATEWYFKATGDVESYYSFFEENSCVVSNKPVKSWSGSLTDTNYVTEDCSGEPFLTETTTTMQLLPDGTFCSNSIDAATGTATFNSFSISCEEPSDEEGTGSYGTWTTDRSPGVYLTGTNCTSTVDCSIHDDRGYWSVYYSWEDWDLALAGDEDTCHSVSTEDGGWVDYYTMAGDSDSYILFLQENSCIQDHLDSLRWNGTVTDSYYLNSYCSGDPILNDVETQVLQLGDGDFCHTSVVSGWGYEWESYHRSVVQCSSPDDTGKTGIYTSIYNCSSAECDNCANESMYLVKYSWSDWFDRSNYDTCHAVDFLVGVDSQTDELDWDSAWRDYYSFSGPDKDSYVEFLTERSCIDDGARWTGSVVSAAFDTDGCTGNSNGQYETTRVHLKETGEFCTHMTNVDDDESMNLKIEVLCANPDGSGDDPGVYLVHYSCTQSETAGSGSGKCRNCEDAPLFATRFSWDHWNAALQEQCHAVEMTFEFDANGNPNFASVNASWVYYTTTGDLESYYGFFEEDTCIYQNKPVETWTGEFLDATFEEADCSGEPTWQETATTLQLLPDGSFCGDSIFSVDGGATTEKAYGRYSISCVEEGDTAWWANWTADSWYYNPQEPGVYFTGTNCSSTTDCSADDERGLWSMSYTWDEWLTAATTFQDTCTALTYTMGDGDDAEDVDIFYTMSGDSRSYYQFLAENSCIKDHVSAQWTGSVTDNIYRDSYCSSSVMMTDTESQVLLLGDGDFCSTGEYAGWGFSWTWYSRYTVSCVSPDGSGHSGIFMSVRNCTSSECDDCSEEVEYITHMSWMDWQDRNFDTCHGVQFLMAEQAQAETLDWDAGYQDFFHFTGPDVASYQQFLTENSCIEDGASWEGSVVSSSYASEDCTSDSVGAETFRTVTLLEDGAFCTVSNVDNVQSYLKTFVSCSDPYGGDVSGVYTVGYPCTDSMCSSCTDQSATSTMAGYVGEPAFVARIPWDSWDDARNGDICHPIDLLFEDSEFLNDHPAFDTDAEQVFFMLSGDTDSYFIFLEENSCVWENRPVDAWSGLMLNYNYGTEVCSDDPLFTTSATSLQVLPDGSFCADSVYSEDGVEVRTFSRFTISCVEETPNRPAYARPYYYYYSYSAALFGRDDPGIYLMGTNCTSLTDCSQHDDRGTWTYHYTWSDFYQAVSGTDDTCHAISTVLEDGTTYVDFYSVTDGLDYYMFLIEHSCIEYHLELEFEVQSLLEPDEGSNFMPVIIGSVVGGVVVIAVIVVVAVVMRKQQTQAKFGKYDASNKPTTSVTHAQQTESSKTSGSE